MKALYKGDFLIIFALLLLAGGISLGYLFVQSDTNYAEIWENDVKVYEIKLATGFSSQYPLKNGEVEIEIDGLRARFSHADCMDQVCVRTGYVDKTAQVAVCLPNRILLKIRGAAADVDFVVH